MPKRLDFSSRGRARVALVTTIGVVGTMVVALWGVSYTTPYMPRDTAQLTWLMAISLPVLMSGPIFYFFADKLRQLAIAHHSLALIAAQDSLTTCLNRGAFATLVDAYLSQVNASQPIEGALLVVDADHFKRINDRYGHSTGDAALKLIADAMKNIVRPTDVVGRVGGEEFAVFLPNASLDQAASIAERIRDTIEHAAFEPDGVLAPLSVSVGAAAFKGPVSYRDLFRRADTLLYEAKAQGRNRVVLRAFGTELPAT